jgi:cytochrome o ubiquinol oxidase subunit 3
MTKSLAIHHVQDPNADTSTPDPHQDTFSKTMLGFWIYLITDCLLFATLFATYAVLHNNTFGYPSSKELFDLSDAFAETMILLFSSVTCGLAVLSAVWDKKNWIFGWLILTFLLGASFLTLELREFSHFVHEGNDWTKSAFLSSFFSLVGTHGLHITVGLFWMAVVMAQILWQGININTFRRLAIFSLFWHFLDLIWIFIFTFVYLMGVI